MEEVLRRTSLAPLAFPYLMLVLICLETEGLVASQGRAGITSIVRWNLRPVTFGAEIGNVEHRNRRQHGRRVFIINVMLLIFTVARGCNRFRTQTAFDMASLIVVHFQAAPLSLLTSRNPQNTDPTMTDPTSPTTLNPHSSNSLRM